MTKKNKNFNRLYPWQKMTKKNQKFHHWCSWPKMLKIKLALLLSMAKNDQENKNFHLW